MKARTLSMGDARTVRLFGQSLLDRAPMYTRPWDSADGVHTDQLPFPAIWRGYVNLRRRGSIATIVHDDIFYRVPLHKSVIDSLRHRTVIVGDRLIGVFGWRRSRGDSSISLWRFEPTRDMITTWVAAAAVRSGVITDARFDGLPFENMIANSDDAARLYDLAVGRHREVIDAVIDVGGWGDDLRLDGIVELVTWFDDHQRLTDMVRTYGAAHVS